MTGTTNPRRPAGDSALLLAFLASGAAALGYELVWTRLLVLALGSESLGVFGVIAGFFLGMVAGAVFLGPRVARVRDPILLFAGLEAFIAFFALLSPRLLTSLARILPAALGPAAGANEGFAALALAVLVAGGVLLPATACMGATFPLLVEAWRRARPADPYGRGIGRLYGANTLGAAVGVFASIHLLLPRAGMDGGAAVLAGLGLLSATLALAWRRGAGPAPAVLPSSGGEPASPRGSETPAPEPGLGLLLFGTGLAGIGLELVTVQVLGQVLQNTVYTFANLLAVYLLGTAAGAWCFQRRAGQAGQGTLDAWTPRLLAALAAWTILAFPLLRAAPDLLDALSPPGAGLARGLGAELALAAALFLAPTLLMGALFSRLLAGVPPRGIGRAYGLNLLGSALAPFVFGLWGFRALGYGGALGGVLAAYLLLFLVASAARGWAFRAALGCAAGVAAWAACTSGPGGRSLAIVRLEPGTELIERREGLMGVVLVTQRPDEVDALGRALPTLHVNQHFRMGGGRSFAERRIGHIGLLLAPGAKRALFLGVASGASLGVVRQYPLERVDAVEIVPEILELLPRFHAINARVWEDPKVRLIPADARRYMAATRERYGLIAADLYHPSRDGAGGLYSLEHFRAVRDHLEEGGIFTQWLPLYQLDGATLRTIVRTFLEAFEESHGFLCSFVGDNVAGTPVLVLVGRRPGQDGAPLRIDLDHLADAVARVPDQIIQDWRDFLATYLLDGQGLRAFAGEGPLNTDLGPRVLFDAPRVAYEARSDVGPRNLALLLEAPASFPEQLIAISELEEERAARMREEGRATWSAVRAYLRGQLAVALSGGEGIPREAFEACLEAYRLDPRLVSLEGWLLYTAKQEPSLAGPIYDRMLEINPGAARAHEVLRRHAAGLHRRPGSGGAR